MKKITLLLFLLTPFILCAQFDFHGPATFDHILSQKIDAKYYFYFQDDLRLKENFFQESIRIFESIPDDNKISLGTRYEWGLNSMFKSTDRKVSTISFNMFLPLRGKRSQGKDK